MLTKNADGKNQLHFKSEANIYAYGCEFFRATCVLVPSQKNGGSTDTFIAAIVNACLSLELFLKSIGAKRTWLPSPPLNDEDEILKDQEPPQVTPLLFTHNLSILYKKVPEDYKLEIQKIASSLNFHDDILTSIKPYEQAFVDWRYGYEKALGTLASHPLLTILNAVKIFCENAQGQLISPAN